LLQHKCCTNFSPFSLLPPSLSQPYNESVRVLGKKEKEGYARKQVVLPFAFLWLGVRAFVGLRRVESRSRTTSPWILLSLFSHH
jgi:hypothetical protein